MQPRQFRIGELAKHLDVKRFVIRFWEKEFGLSPSRSEGGQRFYEEKDVYKMQQIKELLYAQGMTIQGAKKILSHKVMASYKTTIDTDVSVSDVSVSDTVKLQELKAQLITLRNLL